MKSEKGFIPKGQIIFENLIIFLIKELKEKDFKTFTKELIKNYDQNLEIYFINILKKLVEYK
jgi:hypothetical protein